MDTKEVLNLLEQIANKLEGSSDVQQQAISSMLLAVLACCQSGSIIDLVNHTRPFIMEDMLRIINPQKGE